MVKLPHLCRITHNLQNQETPKRFGVTSIRLQVAISRMTSACSVGLSVNSCGGLSNVADPESSEGLS